MAFFEKLSYFCFFKNTEFDLEILCMVIYVIND